jgi:hypothetical protein
MNCEQFASLIDRMKNRIRIAGILQMGSHIVSQNVPEFRAASGMGRGVAVDREGLRFRSNKNQNRVVVRRLIQFQSFEMFRSGMEWVRVTSLGYHDTDVTRGFRLGSGDGRSNLCVVQAIDEVRVFHGLPASSRAAASAHSATTGKSTAS